MIYAKYGLEIENVGGLAGLISSSDQTKTAVSLSLVTAQQTGP